MQGPCFCKPDLMSQCVAVDYKQQISCRFFVKSACADRCMHKNESMDDHCWSQDAQAVGLQNEVERDFVDNEEGYELKDEKITCLSCLHYTCPNLMRLSSNAASRGGLTYGDIEEIAAGCGRYINSNKELEITP